MLLLLERPELYGQPIRLTEAQLLDPYQVLEDFFDDISFKSLKPALAEMVEACLTTDDASFHKPEQRADLLYRYKRIEGLLEAAFVIVAERRQMFEEDNHRSE